MGVGPTTVITIFEPRWHGFARYRVECGVPQSGGACICERVASGWLFRGWGEKPYYSTPLPLARPVNIRIAADTAKVDATLGHLNRALRAFGVKDVRR